MSPTNEELARMLDESRGETRASFENRALMYYYILDEMTAEVGRERAAEVMKRAIRRRGVEVGKKYAGAAEAGDLRAVGEIFCEDSPCQGRLFEPSVAEQAEDRIVLRMDACPLVDAWKGLGLAPDQIDLLCEVSAAVDFGTFEGAGLQLEFKERQAQPGGRACLLELRRSG